MIEIKRILVPTDFSEFSQVALNYGVAFADQFGAAVSLLHVVEPPPSGALLSYASLDDLTKSLLARAQQQMEELHASWSEYNFPVSQIVVEGYPFMEIIRHARENESDMIIMGTHGRGMVKHALLGSVAEKIVRKAPCPVLTVRHPEHEFVHP
jgi:nucleotide-binding universal stress UspA family protein